RRYPNAAFQPLDECTILPPPPPVREDPAPVAEFEYCFELSCAMKSLHKHNNCAFFLGKTQEEGRLMNWQEKPVEQGFRLTTTVVINEPKRLYAARACESLGVTPPEPVTVHPAGSGVVQEAFMAVMPAVEIEGLLGHPSHGYFCHFCDGKLMQEYQLLGDRRWAFRATHATHDQLSDDFYQGHLSAILLPWKRAGTLVTDQYLIYLRERITRQDLDHFSEDWLLQHGVKIDLDALLAAIQQPVLERTPVADEQVAASTRQTHTVQRDPATGERETWDEIAQQYGLSARELLDFNPLYEADPLSLSVGDQLTVQSPDAPDAPKPIRERPPEQPKDFNQALNSYYPYDSQCLEDTTIHPLRETHLAHDIPVVRAKSIVTPVFAKSCNVPEGSTDAGSEPESLSNFSWTFQIMGSAHAATLLMPPSAPPPGVDSGKGTGRNVGAVEKANRNAAVGLTRLFGKLDNVLDNYELYLFNGIGVIGNVFMMPHKVWHHDDTQYTEEELRNLESVQSRIRISLTDPAPGEQYPTVHAWHMNFARIPVFQVDFHEDNQSFSVALGKDGPEMTWLPTATGAPEWQLTPGHEDGYEPEDIRTTPIADEWFPTVETYPADAETHWSDAVLVFPLDSGIPPIYIVFKKEDRRNQPGVVTGKGKDVPWEDGYWLGKAADEGQGQYIPTVIANALRGKEFNRFSELQTAIWLEVANHPILFNQFDKQINQREILKGNAPFSLPKYQVGRRGRFEVHHVQEIQHGGDVYNIDNLRIVMVKHHIRIHSDAKKIK
ncbi:S-type pyocin domain-containing protein, partial [Photobacterium sp. 1_MG-2023]|uniref:S-type pyocin domain-containing protein n=1 Tax=Photobacterium sp. 1_MG-2023 TaxID=3062646 RepID=UPI0026E2668C